MDKTILRERERERTRTILALLIGGAIGRLREGETSDCIHPELETRPRLGDETRLDWTGGPKGKQRTGPANACLKTEGTARPG